jgi:hypothetical protein
VNHPAKVTKSAAPGSAITATTETITATISRTQPAEITPWAAAANAPVTNSAVTPAGNA